MDDFEQKLSRQPMRQIPGEWRGEILSAIIEVGTARRAVHAERTGRASLPKFDWLTKILWPHPAAWAGLAAIWIFIFAVNFSIRDKMPVVAEKISPPSPEMVAELKQQRRLFTELLGSSETRVADRQKFFLPKPRSELTEALDA